MTDRWFISDPALDEVYAGLSDNEQGLRRSQLADEAWQAWQASQSRGTSGTLEDFQRAAVRRVVRAAAESRAAAEASRRRLLGAAPADARTDTTVAVSVPVVSAHPLLARAEHLEADGFPFAAARLRGEVDAVDHRSRRARVDGEVAKRDSLFDTLRDRYGAAAAEAYMRGDEVALW